MSRRSPFSATLYLPEGVCKSTSFGLTLGHTRQQELASLTMGMFREVLADFMNEKSERFAPSLPWTEFVDRFLRWLATYRCWCNPTTVLPNKSQVSQVHPEQRVG